MARGRLFIAITTVGVALTALALGLRAEDAKGGGLVGAQTCATCHEDTVKAFQAGEHGAAMAARSSDMLNKACEGCHGPGAAHVSDPSKTNINRIPKQDACIACHPKAEALMALNLPAHPRNGVLCLDCHTPGHTPAPAKPLLAAAPAVLCAKCHGDIAAAFKLPFAHRQGDKPFDCTACHTVHGENRTGRLREWKDGACLECHLDKGGPYIYPHPPRNVNGCLQCHTPHGSTNPKMLTRSRVADLCLECHMSVPSFHNISNPKFRACQTCHIAIHGSNHDPNLKDD